MNLLLLINFKKRKTVGNDNLESEHLTFAHNKFIDLLCILFNAMLMHNHILKRFMDTIIIPLVTYNKCDLSDCNNYIPIAITDVTSKTLGSVIMCKL